MPTFDATGGEIKLRISLPRPQSGIPGTRHAGRKAVSGKVNEQAGWRSEESFKKYQPLIASEQERKVFDEDWTAS